MRGLRVKLVGLPKEAKAVHHYWPYAYCVAKPAIHCAVFACPPIKTIAVGLGAEACRFDVISNASVADVKVGDWRSIAYCQFESGGLWTVALPLQAALKFRSRETRKGAGKRNRPSDAQTLAAHRIGWR